jgi:hypothetical protein
MYGRVYHPQARPHLADRPQHLPANSLFGKVYSFAECTACIPMLVHAQLMVHNTRLRIYLFAVYNYLN